MTAATNLEPFNFENLPLLVDVVEPLLCPSIGSAEFKRFNAAEKVRCFEAAGVQVFVPEKSERELVAKRIYEELEKEIVKESTLAEFVEIINTMVERDGIEGIILGCTELPLLLNSNNCPVDCLDAVEIHIKKLIELAM